jgi:predicted ATPase
MLVRAEITNYKSVAHATLEFGAENVIVGPNGVGKSNLLDALHFVRDAARDGLDHAITKRHGINSIRRWSKTRPFNVGIRLAFSNGNIEGEYRLSIASAAGDYSVLEEEGIWKSPDPFQGPSKRDDLITTTFKRGPDGRVEFGIPENAFTFGQNLMVVSESELLLSQIGQHAFSPSTVFFRGLYEQITASGAYSIYPNKIREPQTISTSEVLADDGTNLASIIRQMRSTSYRGNRESLTSSIRQVLPIVTEIRIESAGGFYVPVFRVKEFDSGYSHDLNMSQISDGTLRMLGMLTAFYQPRAPARITLEEPEQMIHPGLLPVLLDAARDYLEITQTSRQTFFTTHSPALLDMFAPESIIGATFEDGVSKFAPISVRQLEVIKERLFSAGELLVAEGIMG